MAGFVINQCSDYAIVSSTVDNQIEQSKFFLLPLCMVCGQCPPYVSRWNDGGMEIISVEELENKLNTDPANLARGIHYDFFSTLNSTVKNSLKTTPVSIPSGSNPSTAFLLAEPDYPIFGSNSSILNTTIWHDGSTENRTFGHLPNELNLGTSQVGIGQINTLHSSTLERSISQISTSQISTIKVGMSEISTSQIGTSQIGVSKTGLPQLSTSEISSTQIASLHKDLADGRFTQIDSTQIGSIQLIRPIDGNFGEISLPSSITLQQLLNVDTFEKSHTPNLQNTTVPAWTSFFESPTPFNLKIEIADLPTGQLAEATISAIRSIET